MLSIGGNLSPQLSIFNMLIGGDGLYDCWKINFCRVHVQRLSILKFNAMVVKEFHWERHRVRVVKEIDSKSIGVSLAGVESPSPSCPDQIAPSARRFPCLIRLGLSIREMGNSMLDSMPSSSFAKLRYCTSILLLRRALS